MALDASQRALFAELNPGPIRESGDQTREQAVNLAIEEFRYLCQLEGLPVPSREDVVAELAHQRSM